MMLQPSESLATHRTATATQEPPEQVPTAHNPQPLGTAPNKNWITRREIVFIVIACTLGAALLRTPDTATFELSWKVNLDKSLYDNGRFPVSVEKLPSPIITDLDSDGITDMVFLTYDGKVEVVSIPANKRRVRGDKKKGQVIQNKVSTDVRDLSGGSEPVSIATGYTQPYQSMLQVRQQVIAVLTSDWTTLLFDHELNLLWKTKVSGATADSAVTDPTMLVVPVAIHKGDVGVVIVGGRDIHPQKHYESLKTMRRGGLPENEEELLSSLGHYSVYALEGRSGEERWKHTPQSFEFTPAYFPTSHFQHLKLMLHKSFARTGEVSWHQYRNALRDILPHSWRGSYDNTLSLGHIKKDKKEDPQHVSEHISSVKDMAMEHIAGLAFGGQQPHSHDEHVMDPNVLILRNIKGISVFYLFFGRPLVSLPLTPYHSAHADLNSDGSIDHVTSVVNPGEAGFDDQDLGPDCYGTATTEGSKSKVLFRHSICKATHWTESFVATDQWLPGLNKAGRKNVNHEITEPLAPVLIESVYHGAPLKFHVGDSGWSVQNILEGYVGAPRPLKKKSSQRGSMYDSVFVLSSGRVTSIGPQGEFNWQVDSSADWDSASEVIYDTHHPSWTQDPYQVTFLHSSFTPSATAFAMQAFGKEEYVLVIGWEAMELLSSQDGHSVASNRLPCAVVAPPVIADYTGDGWNDLVITCPEGYYGYSLNRESGLWHSTIVSIFVGVAIVILAVYTRQKNIGPILKAAQD